MPAAMKPIGRNDKTLAEVAYDRISEALLSGALSPGSRLVMDQLAEQLDISRTPVRDALARLEREGMIEPTGRRGFVVRTLTNEDTMNLYEAREAVEGFAARRVAELGPDAIKLVAEVVESTAGVDMTDARAVYEANMTIHRSVAQASENPLLLELFDTIWQRARGLAAFADYIAHDRSQENVRCAHLPLLEALEQGSDEAFAAMRDHIRKGRDTHLA